MADRLIALTLRWDDRTVTVAYSVQARASRVLRDAAERLGTGEHPATGLVLCAEDGRPLHPLRRLCDLSVQDGDTLVVRLARPGAT